MCLSVAEYSKNYREEDKSSQSVSLEYLIKRSRRRFFIRARRVLVEGGRGTGLRSVPVVFSTCFELRRVLERRREETGLRSVPVVFS